MIKINEEKFLSDQKKERFVQFFYSVETLRLIFMERFIIVNNKG